MLFSDPLVFNLQLFHDGYLFGWSCFHDFDEDLEEGLCTIQQGWWAGWHGKEFFSLKPCTCCIIACRFSPTCWEKGHEKRVLLCSFFLSFFVYVVVVGKRPWRWVWLEAGPWWCVQSCITSFAVHKSDRNRIPPIFCCCLCHSLYHNGRPLHLVSCGVLLCFLCHLLVCIQCLWLSFVGVALYSAQQYLYMQRQLQSMDSWVAAFMPNKEVCMHWLCTWG